MLSRGRTFISTTRNVQDMIVEPLQAVVDCDPHSVSGEGRLELGHGKPENCWCIIPEVMPLNCILRFLVVLSWGTGLILLFEIKQLLMQISVWQ